VSIELGLRGVGDQEQHQIGLAHDGEHLAQRAAVSGEAGGARLRHRLAAGAQTNLDADAGAFERVAQVLAPAPVPASPQP